MTHEKIVMTLAVTACCIFWVAAETVDLNDLPPIQKEIQLPAGGGSVILEQSANSSGRWDSLEVAFTNNLSGDEKSKYLSLKDEIIRQTARIMILRDSLRSLNSEDRKSAIENLKADLTKRFNDIEEEFLGSLSAPQRDAAQKHKIERERKKIEMRRQLRILKDRMEQRLK